jgi:hypothetical protein
MIKRRLAILLITTIIISAPALGTGKGARAEAPAETSTVFTPVVVSVINAPNPVKGSDGRYHQSVVAFWMN